MREWRQSGAFSKGANFEGLFYAIRNHLSSLSDAAANAQLFLMLVLSLHKLLLVLRRLLFGKPIIRNVLQRLLRRLAFFWSLLRPTWRLGGVSRSTSDKPPSDKPPDDSPILPPTTFITNDENTTSLDKNTISLDDISCSLYPYAYPPRNISRSSHNLGIQASRSSHNLAIASRHASRSSHNLAIASRNASRSSHNLAPESVFGPDSLGAESVNEYTITYQSPSDPSNSPTSPRPGYSLSSPHLLRPNSRSSFPRGRRSRSSSPGPSIVAIPEGDVVIQLEDVIHSPSSEVKPALLDDRIYPLAPEFFQRYDRVNRM
jgi:hypothetical protein